jgi:hypothetical protein
MIPELKTVWQQFAGTCEPLHRLFAQVPDDRLT